MNVSLFRAEFFPTDHCAGIVASRRLTAPGDDTTAGRIR